MKPDRLLSLGLPLLEDVTEAQLAGIAPDAVELQFAPWQTVFSAGDTSTDVFFVLSGTLMAVHWTADGREVMFSRMGGGQYLGELAALTGAPRSLSVVSRTAARVLSMRGESFVALIDRVETVRWRVLGNLAGRVQALTDRNLQLTTLSVEQRVQSYLAGIAGDASGGGSIWIVEDAPTHAEIAATIGTTREMVSRALSRLAAEGVIRTARQRIEIRDPARLAADF